MLPSSSCPRYTMPERAARKDNAFRRKQSQNQKRKGKFVTNRFQHVRSIPKPW